MSDNMASAGESGATAAAEASPGSGSNVIKITVKTPKEKQTVEISDEATVDELKEEVGRRFNNPSKPQLCLIFAGKILKDPDTLKSHGIKDGVTVHLVIKTPAASSSPAGTNAASSGLSPAAGSTASRPTTDANASPFGLGSLGGLGGLGSMGMGGNDFAGMQQQMQNMVSRFSKESVYLHSGKLIFWGPFLGWAVKRSKMRIRRSSWTTYSMLGDSPCDVVPRTRIPNFVLAACRMDVW
jgi:hypothetical protein